MAKVLFTKRGNFGDRLQILYAQNGYSMPKDGLRVTREMVDLGIIELNAYIPSDRFECEKAFRVKEEQNAKGTILKHLKCSDVSKVSVDWICAYSEFFHCSVAYLYGETDIAYSLGLNSKALDFLITLHKNTDRMPIVFEMEKTLNIILSDADKATDLLQAIGNILGTVTYTASGANIADYNVGTIDDAFLRVVQERRLQMAIDSFKE